jgi:hypothetical protein
MNFLKNLIFTGKKIADADVSSSLNRAAQSTYHLNIPINVNVKNNEKDVESEKLSGINNRNRLNRKSHKFLTTCKQCGHYRFVKRNCMRVVNPNYPFEHSSKGGCAVSADNQIAAGKKLRRYCNCVYCVDAASKFLNEAPGNKKSNQFIYPRTTNQNRMWKLMKENGWRCHSGLYFNPMIKETGMNVYEPFELHEKSLLL